MSIFSKIKARVTSTRAKTKAIAAGFSVAIASVAAVATLGNVSAITITSGVYNCDPVSVIAGGAANVSAYQYKYNHDTTCTANGHTYTTKAYSEQDIYHAFGIGPSDVSAMSSDAVSGFVTKTGDVYIGNANSNTLVATNAISAGRELDYSNGKVTPGQKKVTYGATTFYERAPSVGFLDPALSAMVIMKGGVFQHAILNSCGNPVNGTPKKPATSIKKLVRAAGTSSYSSNVTVKSGSEVQYQITASSTGQVPADNFTVHDTLPSDIKYTSGTLALNGKAVSAADASAFFGKGWDLGTVRNGTNEVFTFNAIAGTMSDTASNCKAESLDNTGFVVADTLGTQQSSANVNTTCTPPPAPELSCTGLSALAGAIDTTTGEQSYTFTASASVKNATITGYTFTVDNKAGSLSSSNKLTQSFAPGNHEVSVTVSATANGKTITATSKDCAVCFTVKPPVSGTLTCEGLSAVAGTQDQTTGDTPYNFTATAVANGNAKITGYALTPDTNAAPEAMNMSADTKSATASHTYAVGTYNASVTVTGTDTATGKTITAPVTKNCEVTVTVKTPLKPNYTISKEVSKSATSGFGKNVSVPSGTTVYYQITVASTGNTPVTNVNVSDNLPKDINYNTGTLKENGVAVSSSDADNFFGKGLVLASIKNQTNVVFTYSAVAGNTATDTDPSCMAETLTNTGYISTTGLSNQNSSATANTTCTEIKGSLACVALTANAGDIDTAGDENFTFTGSATATNATIKTYTFVVTNTDTNKVVATLPVNSGDTSATSATQQLAPGNYTVVLTVTGTDNYGHTVTSPATAKCSTPITVKTPACTPGTPTETSACYTYTCNAFTLTVENDTRTVTVAGFNASSTDTANATPANVYIDWGDNTNSTVTYANAVGTQHTFTADSATVTAKGIFNGPNGGATVSSTACTFPVSFTTVPPTVPPVLPNTGAGDTIAIFFGTVVAGTIAARLFIGRKLARR
jgi:uncharacterized repeat protein (TIGR01451 family)